MKDLDALARLVQALEPWRAHLVLIGGWAHRLYRFHPEVNTPLYQPVATRETDVAFSNEAPLDGDIQAALSEAGFTEELTGEHKPPVTHYILANSDSGFYAEFLTPLHGRAIKRSGEQNATMGKAGITAQRIRQLDILLIDPMVINIGPRQGVPLKKPMDIRVPNPVNFMIQKFLIQQDRPPRKQAQDLLYIHDTLEIFGAQLAQLNARWKDVVAPALDAKARTTVLKLADKSFATVTDTIREAARIPQDRKLSPEQLQAACELALSKILS